MSRAESGVLLSRKIAALPRTTTATIHLNVRGMRRPFASAIAPRAATIASPGNMLKM